MKTDNFNLEEEKDFLFDSVRFYDSKNMKPSCAELNVNYAEKRSNPNFEETDFLETSGIVFNSAQKIYFIGLAEYKTKLTFEQFLYFVFWNREAWNKGQNSSYTMRWLRNHKNRFDTHKFRTRHKFQRKKSITKKNKNETQLQKEIWRSFKGINKDKSKTRARHYHSRSYYERKQANRSERQQIRTELHVDKNIPSRIERSFYDFENDDT